MNISSPLIVTLSKIQEELSRYVYSLWMIFGVTGCLLNLVIFSRPQLRTTSCCIYFFAASADHLLTLILGIGTVMYSLNHPDPQATSLLFCKIRGYIFQISLMLSRWYVAFACIDRYASSSDNVRLRRFARTSIAYRIILLVILVWSIICSHRAIFYEIKGNLCGILTNTGAAIYHSVYVIVGGGVLPAAIMITCALLIRQNLSRKKEKRLHQVQRERRRSYVDQQVLRLLFIQIFSYIIFTIPQLCNLVFNAICTSTPNRSLERLTIERFIAFMAELMLYLFPVTSFYLYSLTSRTFRSELMKVFRLLFCQCFHRFGGRIMPVHTPHSTAAYQQTIIYLNAKQIMQQHEHHTDYIESHKE